MKVERVRRPGRGGFDDAPPSGKPNESVKRRQGRTGRNVRLQDLPVRRTHGAPTRDLHERSDLANGQRPHQRPELRVHHRRNQRRRRRTGILAHRARHHQCAEASPSSSLFSSTKTPAPAAMRNTRKRALTETGARTLAPARRAPIEAVMALLGSLGLLATDAPRRGAEVCPGGRADEVEVVGAGHPPCSGCSFLLDARPTSPVAHRCIEAKSAAS
jgi:hypothetical protein